MKHIKKILPMFLLIALVIPLTIGNPVQAATELAVTDPYIVGVDVVMEGYQGVDQSSISGMGLSAVYNGTVPIVTLQGTGFTETDKAPTDFKTDGITRTFSDSYLGQVMQTSTASGVYQTLKGIQESAFSQYTVDKDISFYSYTPLDTFYQTVNDTMNAIDPAWTAANFSVGDLYALISFDKVMMDAFFADAKAESTFADVSDLYSTNQLLVTTLLDSIFGENIFDIIYAPVNISCYADDWTVAEEVRGVMGLNATDTSINGSTKIVSVRNAMFGYIGERVAPDSVVGLALASVVSPSEKDGLVGFSQTPTTYTVKFRVTTDFVASPLSESLSMILALLQPADVEVIQTAITLFWVENILWSLLAGVGLGAIGLAVSWKKSYRYLAGLAGFVVGFLVTFVILMLATAVF